MSRRSNKVLAIALASLLGVLALMQLSTRETRALESDEPAAPKARVESADLETSLVGATHDGRSITQAEELAVADAVDADEDEAPLDERVEPPTTPISLLVHFVDEHANPVTLGRPGASAWSRDGEEVSAEEVEPGTCEFRGLAAGSWQIVATAVGFKDIQREVIIPRSDTALEIEIVLTARWSVRIVLLTLNGEPYPPRSRAHFDAIATRELPGDWIAERLSSKGELHCGYLNESLDAAGDRRQLGIVVPTCEPPLWINLTMGGHVIDSQRLVLGTTEIVFLLDPPRVDAMLATLRFRIVDGATRAPLNNATIELRCGPRSRHFSSSRGGVVEFTDVPPGIAELRIHIPDYEHEPTEIRLPPGTHLDLGDVALSAAGSGELRVTCEVPDGVDQFETAWARSESARDNWSVSTQRTTSTLPRDQAVIRLGRGEWRLWCSGNNGEQRYRSRTIDVAMNGSSIEIATRLELLSKLVLVPAKSPRRVTITDVTEGRGAETTHEVGSLPVLLELTIGRFEVVVHRPDGAESSVTVNLGPDGARVELE